MSTNNPAPAGPTPPSGGNPPPPSSPQPGLVRRAVRRFINAHRAGSRQRTQAWLELIGGWLAILAVAVGGPWVVLSWWVDHRTDVENVEAARDGAKAARKGPDLEADLKIAAVGAEIRADLKGSQEQSGPKEKADKLRGVHVDITAQNLATAPSLITAAKLMFRESFYLEPCYGVGGDLVSTIDYDLTIPDDQPFIVGARSHKVPFSRSTGLTHQIPANSYEKFTLTTGPRSIPDGASPWVGVFDIVLTHDSGKTLKYGPVAVVNSGGNPMFYPIDKEKWHIDPKESVPGCTDVNARKVRSLLKTPGVTASAELKSLDAAFRASGH